MGTHLPTTYREVAYTPHASQLAFHELRTKFKGFSGPVGSGKSLAFVHEALRLAYANPGCTGLIGAPTYVMLRDSTRMAMLEMLDQNEVPYTLRKQENTIHLPEPDSTILCRSLDQPERLRGTNLAWFGIDELTYAKANSWTRLQGRLRAPNARERHGFAVWTPKGFDWVYKRFVAKEVDPKHPEQAALYDSILAKPRENAANVGDDYYDSLKSYDEKFYRQEVLGEYLNVFSGAVYYTFDRGVNVKPVEFDKNYPLCWALDFNISPMCSVIGQAIDTTTPAERRAGKSARTLHVLDELALPDTRTHEAVAVFLERIQPYIEAGLREIYLYGDSSGNSRQRASTDSDWSVVRRELARALPSNVSVSYRVPSKQPEVKARVTSMCSQLRGQDGRIGMLIHPQCREFIKDLEEVVWRQDLSGRQIGEIDKKELARTHLSDACGYWVNWDRRIGSGPSHNEVLF